MNYSRSEFYNLMQAVEDQGGEHLDELCAARSYIFKLFKAKPGDADSWDFEPLNKTKKLTLPSCGNSALFTVPYKGEDDEDSIVQVCAVEDDMGRWPRFADQVAG